MQAWHWQAYSSGSATVLEELMQEGLVQAQSVVLPHWVVQHSLQPESSVSQGLQGVKERVQQLQLVVQVQAEVGLAAWPQLHGSCSPHAPALQARLSPSHLQAVFEAR